MSKLPLRSWALLGSFCLITGAQAQSAATAAPPPAASASTLPQPVAEVEGITEYRLANGMKVLLVPDDSKPTTTVNVTYRVGSRHESYGETGMAHLLEHLVFKGTPTTRNAFAEFTKRGLRANGTTSFDRTNYFASFAAHDDNLRWYLGWQADVMVNSFIAKTDLDSEMTVVRNEMEMGENRPGSVLFQRTIAAMYDWHNYGHSTIGARSDVENVDIQRLQAFYRHHYQPDNATLIVAGRFDPQQVLRTVVASFGAIPRPTRVLAPTYTLDPAQDGERSVTVRRVGGTPLIYMAFHMPPAAHPDMAAATLLGQLLGDAPSGRLHKQLVEKQLAAGVFGTTLELAEPGALLLGAQLAPGQDMDQALAAMITSIEAVTAAQPAGQPITAAELERARTQWLNAWEQGFTDPERVGVELSSAIANGDWRLYFLERNRVRQVTLDDVNRVARERLMADNRTVALFRPTEKPQRPPTPARVDVAAQLQGFKGDSTQAVAESFEATPANLDARTQRSRLDSGLQLALLPKGTRGRAVQARLALRFGDQQSLAGRGTALELMASLLDKGAQGLSRQQVSDQLDRLRTELSIGYEGQTLALRWRTTREHLPDSIRLIGQLLRHPSFPPEALEEARQQWLAGVAQQRQEPQALIANALARHGNPYPKGDPRHQESFDEMEAQLKAVQRVEVVAAHARFISAAVGELAVVGDHDPAAVQAAAQQALGDWAQPAAGPLPYSRLATPLVAVVPLRLVLKTPDKQNANLQAQLALPLTDLHPDYPALTVANYLFGGSGNSRLWQRIREKDGLSYDVGSSIDWNAVDQNSMWTSTAIFAPQNQAKVEAAWQQELKRSLDDGFSEVELQEAQQGLLNYRRLSRAQDSSVASLLLRNVKYERRFKLSQEIDDAIGRITLAQVNAAWRKYMQPDKMAVAWGGDFKPP